MKVLLLKDVRGCGQAHQVKDVADGYAVNFLLPHKYAVAATDDKIKEIQAAHAAREAARQKDEAALDAKIDSLNGKKVSIAARATEKGGLFKAIVAADVAKAIRAEHSLEIPETSIALPEPIKTVGEHVVHLAGKLRKAQFGVVVTAQ